LNKVRTQTVIFETEVLPSLFHDSPEQFLYYLSRDGNKFLHFYWNIAAKDIDEKQRVPFLGLNYEIHQPGKSVTVILITLPEPRLAPEAYFIALIYRPLRRTPFLNISDTTLVITLERASGENGQPATQLVEWDRKLRYGLLGAGPGPSLKDFYRAVCNLINN